MKRAQRIVRTPLNKNKPALKNTVKKTATSSTPVQESLLIFDDDEPVERAKPKPTNVQKIAKPVIPKISQSEQAATADKADKLAPSDDLYQQSIDLIFSLDPEQNISKDELIERMEYKYKTLKKHDPDNKEIGTIEHVLSHLKEEQRSQKIDNLNKTRQKQDYLVTKNKLSKEHFNGKTNLTPESYKEFGEDEQLKILINSKRFFEKISHYKNPPKNLVNVFAKGKNRGNRRVPNEVLEAIESKFIC